MPLNTLNTILAYTCAPAAIMGMFWYKRVDKNFHPFIWAMMLSLIAESIATITIFNGWEKPWYFLTGNMYFNLNILFYLLFFYLRKAIEKQTLYKLLLLCVVVFLIGCFFRLPHKRLLLQVDSFYNLIIFLLAAQLLGKQVFNLKQRLCQDPIFLICSAASLFCAVFVLVNVLYIFQAKSGFNNLLFTIQRYVNAATYLIFALAVWCMPKKMIFENRMYNYPKHA